MNEEITKKCCYCCQQISKDANVCHKCGRHQQWFHNNFNNFATVASIVLVIIASVQLVFAHKERVDVNKALTQAIEAKNIATKAADDVGKTLKRAIEAKDIATNAADRSQTSEQYIKKLDEGFRKQALFITEITWLQLETKHQFGTEKAKRSANKIIDDVNSLLRIAIPKDNDRAKWIQEMQSY